MVAEFAVELRSAAAAEQLKERFAANGYRAVSAVGAEVRLELAPELRSLNAVLRELDDWLAERTDGYGVVRIDGRRYAVEPKTRRAD